MDKITFRQHLDKATTAVADFTRQLCYNYIVDNYQYRITPNSRTHGKGHEYLTEKEIGVLNAWNEYEHKTLTAEQIVNLFHHDNQVPAWIDITVYEAGKRLTIIDLYCSRRLRDDNELYHQGPLMPFHLLVAIPPDHLRIEKNGKFDVNWKAKKLLDGQSNLMRLFRKLFKKRNTI